MLLAYVSTGGINWVHVDHLGTPQMLTDDTGAVVWDADYRPFGAAAVTVDESFTDAYNLRFPGQYYDAETGLHYNWFRDYDAALGRYLESDPIGLAGGWNTYAYVGGNPVIRVDPEGLQTAPPIIIPRPMPLPGIPRPLPPIPMPMPFPDAMPDDELVDHCTRLYVLCVQQGWGGDWTCSQCHFYCTGINKEWPFHHCSPDSDLIACRSGDGTA